MANKSGTSSGVMIGVGSSRGGLGVGGGYQTSKSELAKLTAPPVPDGTAGESIALIFLLIVEFNLVAVGLSIFISFFTAIFIAIPLTIATAIFGIYRSKRNAPKREATYKAAMRRWEHSWICLRCGNNFVVR